MVVISVWSTYLILLTCKVWTLVCGELGVLPSTAKTRDVIRCDPPNFPPPFGHAVFKTTLSKYPRKAIHEQSVRQKLRKAIFLTSRHEIHQNKIEKLSLKVSRPPAVLHLDEMCSSIKRNTTIKHMYEHEGYDCWTLRPWWGTQLTWVECGRFCEHVDSHPPFYSYVCVPGSEIPKYFWIFCPKTQKLHFIVIWLPQACSCKQYTCWLQPKAVKVV